MAIDIITLTGGLPRDAELRFTPQGAAVTNFTLANSDNRYDEQQQAWVKSRAMYLDVTIWNETSDRKQNPVPWAEMAGELRKGDQVAVKGKLITRTWEKDGQKHSKVEFQAVSFYRMPTTQASQQTPAQDVWNQAAQAGQTAQTGGFGQQEQPPF